MTESTTASDIIELLLDALERIEFAAQCRDNTMGDQCRLIDVKAGLASAAVLARSAMFEAHEFQRQHKGE